MQIRILHIASEDPWVCSSTLLDIFGITNPAVSKVKRFSAENSLKLIESAGWIMSKVKEQDSGVSVLFIKNEIENE
jgi:hypothetical protein